MQIVEPFFSEGTEALGFSLPLILILQNIIDVRIEDFDLFYALRLAIARISSNSARNMTISRCSLLGRGSVDRVDQKDERSQQRLDSTCETAS